ncbi:MAG: hypothetical protein JRJ15_08870 [Deltaproteobacteria bacterium]|nr:hypothetical protein [Deltaproteobacteria bacterium]
MGVSFEKSTTEFCQGYNTPAQSSFLDTTKAQPMTGDDPGLFVINLTCCKIKRFHNAVNRFQLSMVFRLPCHHKLTVDVFSSINYNK